MSENNYLEAKNNKYYQFLLSLPPLKFIEIMDLAYAGNEIENKINAGNMNTISKYTTTSQSFTENNNIRPIDLALSKCPEIAKKMEEILGKVSEEQSNVPEEYVCSICITSYFKILIIPKMVLNIKTTF